MSRFRLPMGLEGIDKLPETNSLLQNLFHTHDESESIVSRPGISGISEPGDVCRGGFKWNDGLYYIYSDRLVKIDDVTTGASTFIGTIAGDDFVYAAAGAVDIALVARGSASYVLDKADTLTETTNNPNFVPFVSQTALNGRAVYVPQTGDKTVFSDVGDFATIDANSFFDAAERPDNTVFCWTLDNYLYLAGTQSIQRFRNVPDPTTPFQTAGSAFDYGYIGGFLETQDSIIFIGRKRNQSPGFFLQDANRVVKISNPPVDKLLESYTETELSQVVSARINWLGFDIAVFTFREDSLLYYMGDWSRMDTVIEDVSRPWDGGFIVEFNNRYYSGSDGNFGLVADTNFDYGNRITRIIEGSIQQQNMDYLAVAELELGVSQGFVPGEKQSIGLQTTEDGLLYGPIIYEDLALTGNYPQKLVWNPAGGLGTYEGFFGYRLVTRENVVFNANHLILRGRM